jgi:hypothetical protein
MAQFYFTFPSNAFGSEGSAQLPFGLSPSVLGTLAVLLLALVAYTCVSLSIFEVTWRSSLYTYLVSYSLPALSSTAVYYLQPRCASITALAPADFPTVGLLGALAYALLLRTSHQSGVLVRAGWQARTCSRRGFALLLAFSLLSSCGSHSAVNLLAARWGWEGTVARRPSSVWEAGGNSMALVLLGAGQQQQQDDGSGGSAAGDAAQWWDTAPATCTAVFGATAWALRVGSLAALAWGAYAGSAAPAAPPKAQHKD